MKTVLILLTIFIFKCHSKNKIYLIETDDKDEGDNSRKTRRIEAGSDYGNDDPSPYGEPEPYKAKVKPYDEEVTTTTKKGRVNLIYLCKSLDSFIQSPSHFFWSQVSFQTDLKMP